MAFYNPFRPAYIEDPYPALAQLRRQEPVHRSTDLNAWVVTSYEHCRRLLRDDETFSSDPTHASGGMGEAIARNRAILPLGMAPILGNSDAPDHTRLRAIVNRAFTPRAIADMRPKVAASVEALLGAAPDGPLEVMHALAEPLAVNVVLEHMGVPEADRERVRDWSTAIMRARAEGPGVAGVLQAADAARTGLLGYLETFVPEDGRTSILQTLTTAAAAGEALTPEEMAMFLIHISLAGNGPTAYAIGNAVLALGTHPEQLAVLVADPELAPSAVEELLRFDGPTHVVARFALVDTKLGARTIRAGDTAYAVVAAANRDPAAFPDPDELDLRRADNHHLSFGVGTHFCLGSPLARIELELVLRALIGRYGAFRVVAMQRGGTFLLRGTKSVVIAGG